MSQPSPSRARTLACQRCRSPIPMMQPAPTVCCPACGLVQAVDPNLLRDIAAHQAAVAAQFQGLQEAAEQQDVGARRYRALTDPKFRALQYLGLVVVLGGMYLASAMGARNGPALHWLLLLVGFGVVSYFTYWGIRRRKLAGPKLAAAATVRCPQCGASQALVPGQALERCAFCGAMLVASAEDLRRMEEAAREAARRQWIELRRRERLQASAALESDPAVYMFIGPAIMVALFSVVGLQFAATGTATRVLGTVAGILVALAIPGGYYYYSRWAIGRLLQHMSRLTVPFGGQASRDPNLLPLWLNRFWSGPLDNAFLNRGPYHVTGALTLAGYPVLVQLDMSHDKVRTRRALVLVACNVPGGTDDSPPPQLPPTAHAAASTLASWDCSVAIRGHGIALTLGHGILNRPSTWQPINGLENLIQGAVHLAQQLGATPGAPIP